MRAAFESKIGHVFFHQKLGSQKAKHFKILVEMPTLIE